MSAKVAIIAYLSLVSALIIVCAFSYWQYLSAKDAAHYSVESVEACQLIAAKIERLRAQAVIASTQKISKTVASTQLIEAASSNGIGESKITSIQHLPAQTIESTSYVRESVVLTLSQVDIVKLVRLILDLRKSDQPLEATALILRTPGRIYEQAEKLEVWDAEITFSRLVLDLN